jgi:hypothetical protein
VSDVELFKGMLAAPNDLVIVGGAVDVRVAFDVLPVPALAEVTVTLLFFTPPVVAVTFAPTRQDAPGAKAAPVRLTDVEPAVAIAVPPQVLLSPLGVVTTKPAGKLSVNATPVIETTLAAGFVMRKLSEVEPFTATLAAPKDFAMTGGLATVRFALAVLPVPPFVELTAPVVLVRLPDAVPVTFTTTVQVLFTATVPPVSDTLPEPAVAVTVPPHEFVRPLGVVTTSPAGSESVNATPVSATVFAGGFVTESVSEVVPFSGTADAPKAFAIEGGASIVTEADAVPPVPPCVEVTTLVVLFCVPAVMPVTFTANVQDELAARVAADRLTALAPEVPVIVPPPQVPVNPLGVETTNPVGKVSVKPTAARLCVVLLF